MTKPPPFVIAYAADADWHTTHPHPTEKWGPNPLRAALDVWANPDGTTRAEWTNPEAWAT